VKAAGEPAVKAMETGYDIVVMLVKEGPAAAWEKIKEQLGNLKDMVLQGIMDFVVEAVVKKAVAKVLSLLVPGGAFIQAIVSIYDTIMVFVDKLGKILQVAKAFLGSMMEIASGAIGGAANKVETTLAGLLTLAIDFLAGFLGLGKIADKVMNIINTKVRQPIDKALDKLVNWIVTMAQKAKKQVKAGVAAVVQWWRVRKVFTGADGKSHTISSDRRDNRPVFTVRSKERTLEEIIADQPESKQKILRPMLESAKAKMGGSDTEDAKKQEARHTEMQNIINKIAAELGKVRPTVVTYTTIPGERAHQVVADPLTKQPGIYKGGPSEGRMLEEDLFRAFVQPKEQKRHIKGREVRLEAYTMIVKAHLLANKLNGPAERWNLANASRSINEKMKAPEKRAQELTDAGKELRYVTTVQYHAGAEQPPAAKDAAAQVNKLPDADKLTTVRRWLGYYFASEFRVELKSGETKEEYPCSSDFKLPLKLGPAPREDQS
jgi:hypothetical protein